MDHGTAAPTYVQDKLMEYASRISTLLTSRNAYFYVCGDTQRTIKDVHNTLVNIIRETHRVGYAEANKFLARTAAEGRYRRDIW